MSYDPLLEEQLAQVGVRPDQLPTAEQYWDLLELVSGRYAGQPDPHTPSSVERGAMVDELLAALDEVLAALARLSRSVPPNPEAVDATRRQWVSRLHDANELGRAASAEQALALAASYGRSLDALFDTMASAFSAEAAGGALHRELTAANRLVLPERDWLDTGAISLAAASQAVGACSGDFWLAHRLPDQRTLIVVGDVTGHGAASMILAAGARAACALVAARAGATVRDFLEAMHRVISELGRGDRMMTCLVALFEGDKRELTVANAGHRLPLHVRSAGETGPILARGAPLGSGPAVDVDVMKVTLAPGDGLLMYTDGVVETEDDDGEQFTERRLRTLLTEQYDSDPRITRDKLLTDLATFRGRRARTDDTTFVIARVPPNVGADDATQTRS